MSDNQKQEYWLVCHACKTKTKVQISRITGLYICPKCCPNCGEEKKIQIKQREMLSKRGRKPRGKDPPPDRQHGA